MVWTKEKKREERLKKKRLMEQREAAMGREMVKKSPPDSKMKAPIKKMDIGSTNVDYGGHQKALNFVMPEEIQEVQLALNGDAQSMAEEGICHGKIGTLTIGLAYEGDWKANSRIAGKGERTMCETSEKYLEFLLLVKRMIQPLIHSTLSLVLDDCMRVNILRGARTKAHTDSYKGNAPNLVFIVNEPGVESGYLCYDTFPVFKHSVVKLHGKFYIPHSFSEASDECRCIGANPDHPSKPIYYVFPSSVIDEMEPYGNLSFGIVGWKAKGTLQIVEKFEDTCIYRAPLVFSEYTWDQVLNFASKDRVHSKPRIRVKRLSKTNTWMKFEATMHRHWWVGIPMSLRYHVFFRTIRETISSSNIIRTGKRINYIDAKDDKAWKICRKEKWEPLTSKQLSIKDFF